MREDVKLMDVNTNGKIKLGDKYENAINIVKSMPEYHYYFPDHRVGHVRRIIELLNKDILPQLKNKLNSVEEEILFYAAILHDIGMGNPKTEPSTNIKARVLETKEERESVRENHEEISYKFLMNSCHKIGIKDIHKAAIISNLCKSHRKKNYVRKIFEKKTMRLGSTDIRVQLLASLLKIADALDTTYQRIDENKTYFVDLPENDEKYWDACKYIAGVKFDLKQIILETNTAQLLCEDEKNKKREIIIQKALDIFSELFAVLPFTLDAGLPWIMIKVEFEDNLNNYDYKYDIWKRWWFEYSDFPNTTYEDIKKVAQSICGKVSPIMKQEDTEFVLRELRKNDYPVPPISPKKEKIHKLWDTYTTINSPECNESFISTLNNAKYKIELMLTDGLTHDTKISEIIKKKLKPPYNLKITLFLLDPDVIHKIEGENEKLEKKDAQNKIDAAKKVWRDWYEGILNQKTLNDEQIDKIKESFKIIFIRNKELAYLNGSAIIDDKILRLNIRMVGESSSRGVLLHFHNCTNLLFLVKHYIRDMYHYGKEWIIDEKKESESIKQS